MPAASDFSDAGCSRISRGAAEAWSRRGPEAQPERASTSGTVSHAAIKNLDFQEVIFIIC